MEQVFGRQGDVAIQKVDALPEGQEVKRENGKLILAYGEVTGHSHAIAAPQIKMIQVADGSRYLEARTSFTVRHQEHAPLTFPPGVYHVWQQREYSPSAIRTVAD
jgi:hypothetical protein